MNLQIVYEYNHKEIYKIILHYLSDKHMYLSWETSLQTIFP
jgi:hypothetical protein